MGDASGAGLCSATGRSGTLAGGAGDDCTAGDFDDPEGMACGVVAADRSGAIEVFFGAGVVPGEATRC